MKDCIICGATIQFYGNDGICPACQTKINAVRAGERAYRLGYNACLNPHIFGTDEFNSWYEGWKAERDRAYNEELHAKAKNVGE